MTIPNNMTIEEWAERRIKRQAITESEIAKAGFTLKQAREVSEAAGNPMSDGSMAAFLNQMVIEGILSKDRVNSRTLFYAVDRRPTWTSRVKAHWCRRDNGLQIGMYYPLGNFA